MEGVTEGVNNMNISETQKKNRIQVSNTKKSLFFYVNLSKRYMQQYNEVELSALGMDHIVTTRVMEALSLSAARPVDLFLVIAISTVVTIAEILKNNGFAVEKKIRTLTVDMRDEAGARPIPKAKIEIVLGKTEKFDELMAAEAEQNGDNEEQN